MNCELPLFGNIMIKFNSMGTLSNTDLFRATFNTAFINSSNILKLNRYEISPEKVHRDFNKFPEEFEVILEFADFCKGEVNTSTQEVIRPPCTSTTTHLENICEKCQQLMHSEIVNWKRAAYILQEHDRPDVAISRQLLSSTTTDKYIKTAEKKKLKWTDTQYAIKAEDYAPRTWNSD